MLPDFAIARNRVSLIPAAHCVPTSQGQNQNFACHRRQQLLANATRYLNDLVKPRATRSIGRSPSARELENPLGQGSAARKRPQGSRASTAKRACEERQRRVGRHHQQASIKTTTSQPFGRPKAATRLHQEAAETEIYASNWAYRVDIRVSQTLKRLASQRRRRNVRRLEQSLRSDRE